ncbi:50S ribosomal protein L6 [Enterococcus ureilyticus]|uniref:Large ribosomal subunit protein uL6 n=2 Tax=Enterococcus TaxID=1350 RepID=R2SZS5_9ENTE|nr:MULTISPECIES: 50S ribosomal protein L6 [Enterococcus]EOH98291.1 50S ribosomal protein L6 [Enterococcus haemoperoxidus ATCC BAA-382]EOT59804.1 50S ribosomal protein L6 [Enterococcus haemoperoxidus ATCC BAA-382]MBM7687587.1 large subunit ribosomal protein L6 [Enterococcus ureilyticus]MBO0445222.1 50S ribosomal protein L6 [Enterococcus ureilyticus]OEG21418.1 50S ribosomal protein L6 [Enterococcus ureilyticus]
MSRIGNKIVVLPAGVEVKQEGNNITVKGPKGELTREFSADIKMNIEGNEVTFTRPNDSKDMKTIHGTTRANFNNMVVGVSTGFEKGLELIGVGYRAQMQGTTLVLNVGYSHPVEITPPAGVTVEVPSNTQVVVKGANKEHVGELAANIRGTRPPEPYKGKGIRYVGEFVRRKEGKTGK